ncbi:MAG: glycosyltransferase family 4 protein [Pseudomonadota bacterium]
MHIALWSPGWPLEKHQNGVVTYVHSMRQEFEALGHKVSVFTSMLDSSNKDERVHLARLRPFAKLLRRLAARSADDGLDIFDFGEVVAAEMLAVHRREPIDVIEMEETFGWARDVARITKIPTLVKLHGPAFLSLVEEELLSQFGRVRVEREGEALRSAPAVAAPARVTLTKTIERYGLSPYLAQTICNPLTLSSDTPLWCLKRCDQATILFVGRFDRPKGADVLLRAFELMLRDRPHLKLVVVGPDVGLPEPDGTRTHFDSFRDSLFPEPLRSRVDFRGRMPHGEIAQLRTQAMVTVVPSRWENQSYAALEAMFQGCPVVCSDAGGMPESVIHGSTGLLAKSGEPESFALALASVFDDLPRAAELGAAARIHVLEYHLPRKVAGESLALYERVIAGVAMQSAK